MNYKTFIIKEDDKCVVKGENEKPVGILLIGKEDDKQIIVPLFAFCEEGTIVSPRDEENIELHFDVSFLDHYIDRLNEAAGDEDRFGYILRCEPRVGLAKCHQELSLGDVADL